MRHGRLNVDVLFGGQARIGEVVALRRGQPGRQHRSQYTGQESPLHFIDSAERGLFRTSQEDSSSFLRMRPVRKLTELSIFPATANGRPKRWLPDLCERPKFAACGLAARYAASGMANFNRVHI